LGIDLIRSRGRYSTNASRVNSSISRRGPQFFG
jgi:hypothetical protein